MSRVITAGVFIGCIMFFVITAMAMVERIDQTTIAVLSAATIGLVIGGATVGIVTLILVRWSRGDQPIDATYRETPAYQPPQAQIPPPKIITVPRYVINGAAKPWPAVHLQTVTDDETLTVPLARLMVFLALPTPSRAEWSGDRAIYGQCAAFCESHGLLERTARGGYAWKDAYPIESRKSWADQWADGTSDE